VLHGTIWNQNPSVRALVAARNFASELEREKISQRTHENLLKKAKDGKPA
jgi:DNA invertase Pin-like site-specific DNA recombinase